ncbi:IclR family transcriptional regulator [Rhodococcus indonesiensis]
MTEAAAPSSARRSPPTERVVQVLDHLVAHPEVRFGLSELARRLGMSKPTCLGILTALTDAGYLMRHPADRSYGLGPALIVAGRAAQRGFAVGPVTQRHLAALGAEFGATCAASAVVGDRIAVLDVAGPDPAGAGARVGEVYPFAPPVGLMYVLWDSDERLEQWLAREPTLPVRLDRERLRDVVAECRAAGYLVESLTAGGRRLHALMAGVAAHDLPAELRELLGEMVSSLGERVLLTGAEPDDAEHPVNLLAAPVHDADGRQSVVLTLHVGTTLTNREIARRGAALVDTAEAVTRELGGRRPTR